MDYQQIIEATLKQLIIKKHAYRKMRERKISFIDVKREIINGKIIESYPDDFPYPSCLVLLKIDDEPVHVVCAPAEKGLIIITIYKPGMEEWDEEFKKRKEYNEMR